MRLLPGSPAPLGASWDGDGANFAAHSENATGVELCLLDADGQETRLPLHERTGFIDDVDEEGRRIVDDDFFLVLDGSNVPLELTLPRSSEPEATSPENEDPWQLLVDTNNDDASQTVRRGERTSVVPRSLKLFIHPTTNARASES